MLKIIDYYAGLSSPWTYLGHRRLCDIASRHNAQINFKPVDFGLIFPATGGLPLAKRAPERQRYRFMELKRWKAELNIPLNLEPKYFPVDAGLASYMCLAAAENNLDALGLGERFLQAVWKDEQDISNSDTLIEIADQYGFKGQELLDQAKAEKYSTLFKSYSQEAVDKGVFGAPSYVIDDEIFWGQDRLDFVEKKLIGEANS
ncbi:2-hydroxychromene-2-carboxylate isomerase [Sneathiella glossodoripedis]|uniref:2-hydroxychromene-2-carboxylate isomerase n=1 Tax=Sneathiella glossodoripedis TaxID=418853 RepID=UPI000470358A|nr:2-hydroxychromene-2-carboxylate isomerase [Sneathiella glossodoripedis]